MPAQWLCACCRHPATQTVTPGQWRQSLEVGPILGVWHRQGRHRPLAEPMLVICVPQGPELRGP